MERAKSSISGGLTTVWSSLESRVSPQALASNAVFAANHVHVAAVGGHGNIRAHRDMRLEFARTYLREWTRRRMSGLLQDKLGSTERP